MLIGIDGNEANVSDRVGVNKYAYEIIKNLKRLQDLGQNPHRLIVYLKNKPLDDMPKENEKFKYKILSGGPAWILTKLMPYLYFSSQKPDILFSPSHYTVPFSPVPRVISIMDLGYLEDSDNFSKKTFWQLKYWTANSISTSKYIIAISNATRNDIVRHYPDSKNKIKVIYLGYDKAKFNIKISLKEKNRVKNKYSIVSDYILYLGTLKPSKNIEKLIQAFYGVSDKFPEMRLVIAGKKGWMYENIFKAVAKYSLDDRIIFTDFIREKDKPGLISGARAFVIPSLWEGFGIDALSALACGTPVIASHVGSLPEVLGEAGIFIDPKSSESIKEGIVEVLQSDIKKYNRIVGAGMLQLSFFSWEKCALETLKVLENATR